jgi:hypothetical protein
MSSTLISLSHAGGQGKTTVAQLLYIWANANKAEGQYKLASADFKDDTGRSKIGKLYPNKVEEFGTGAELSAVRTENDANASIRYWDKFGNIFLVGGYVVDIGANVIKSIFEWAGDRRLATILARRNAPKIEVFCVCKAEKHAADDVHRLMRLFAQGHALRPQSIHVVMNEAAGPFGGMKLQEGLHDAFPDMRLNFIKLPKCQSEIWAPMERFGVSIERALEMSEDEVSEILDVDTWTASAGLAELRSWFDASSQSFKEAGAFGKSKA